jgi:hypothetical protein
MSMMYRRIKFHKCSSHENLRNYFIIIIIIIIIIIYCNWFFTRWQ